MLGTIQVAREKAHSNEIIQSITLMDPQVASRLQAMGGAYAKALADPTLRTAEGAALLSQQVTREANVLAYNDIFLIVFWLSCLTLLWLVIQVVKIRMSGVSPMAESLAELARKRAQK